MCQFQLGLEIHFHFHFEIRKRKEFRDLQLDNLAPGISYEYLRQQIHFFLLDALTSKQRAT